MALLSVLVSASIAGAGEQTMSLGSVPSGARVEMGGTEIGTTPLTLQFPTAYFQAPNTVWARHLSAPIVIVLKKSGYQDKRVELGQGPNSWVSINGATRFDYYLLKRSYMIELEKKEAPAPASTPSYVEELRSLVKLRAEGILSEEEFLARKRILLGLGSPTPGGSDEPQPSATDSPISASVNGSLVSKDGDPWIYSWELTVTNHTAGALTVDTEIQFRGADGAVVARLPKPGLVVAPGAPAVFSGTFDLAAEAAQRVVSMAVLGARRLAPAPAQDSGTPPQ